MELALVTPNRRLLENVDVSAVSLPSQLGELEVLPGHAPLLAVLDTGVLKFDEGSKKRLFAISHGFVEIKNDKVTVLAETCEESHEIDLERAKRAEQVAQEKLSSTLTKTHFRKYELKLQRALVRQQIGQ